jgi:hypothetical protein
MSPKYLTKIILTYRETGEDQAYEPITAKEILASKNTQYVLNVEAMAGLGFDAEFLAARGFQAAPPAPVAADVPDFDMWATRQQLIDAFGKFTGMDATWFDNLTTSPSLRAARKCIGQGGRHNAEPLFCPYEVMQWLADPKRKKGRKLGGEKAWQLLKAHFPKAYALNSIGDPNAD